MVLGPSEVLIATGQDQILALSYVNPSFLNKFLQKRGANRNVPVTTRDVILLTRGVGVLFTDVFAGTSRRRPRQFKLWIVL